MDSEIPENSRIASYSGRLIAGEFDDMGKGEIAKALDVDPKTLWAWERKMDWPMIMAEKRKLYSREILAIDRSMIRESKKGSVAASELCYRRFDGYIPESKTNLVAATDADLMAELEKVKAEQGVAIEPSGSNLPGTGAAAGL